LVSVIILKPPSPPSLSRSHALSVLLATAFHYSPTLINASASLKFIPDLSPPGIRHATLHPSSELIATTFLRLSTPTMDSTQPPLPFPLLTLSLMPSSLASKVNFTINSSQLTLSTPLTLRSRTCPPLFPPSSRLLRAFLYTPFLVATLPLASLRTFTLFYFAENSDFLSLPLPSFPAVAPALKLVTPMETISSLVATPNPLFTIQYETHSM
jgi:hypothetical protein